MLHPDTLDCPAAREQLSARLDGELADERALALHLAHCDGCRDHERALGALARDFDVLRRTDGPASSSTASSSTVELWPRIERRLRFAAAPPAFARVAAALIGFVGLGGAALLVERAASGPAPGKHLVERLAPDATGPDTLFAALPEYRLLRALPREESR